MSWYLGKIAFLFLRPSNLLVLLALAGCLAAWRGHRFGLPLASIAVALIVAVTLLPVGAWLTRPLEARFSAPAPMPEEVHGFVVLGGGTNPHLFAAHGRPDFDDAADRYLALIELAKRYPRARAVFTGGSGSETGAIAEADVIEALWLRHGLPRERLLLDRDARNTVENARNAFALARPGAGEVWLLVTSAKHMPRSVACFRAVGFRVLPFPVDYRAGGSSFLFDDLRVSERLYELDEAAYEWFGLFYYRLLGHTRELFPGSEP
ncbi:MAG: YdcF family protein [Geminicoccaceae bacterium]|nr:YdcF family protein [Geminicoccaceae bacterium]MDW8342253.1 YdcF family protein [Geminicoccaceae bacterium]